MLEQVVSFLTSNGVMMLAVSYAWLLILSRKARQQRRLTLSLFVLLVEADLISAEQVQKSGVLDDSGGLLEVIGSIM